MTILQESIVNKAKEKVKGAWDYAKKNPGKVALGLAAAGAAAYGAHELMDHDDAKAATQHPKDSILAQAKHSREQDKHFNLKKKIEQVQHEKAEQQEISNKNVNKIVKSAVKPSIPDQLKAENKNLIDKVSGGSIGNIVSHAREDMANKAYSDVTKNSALSKFSNPKNPFVK